MKKKAAYYVFSLLLVLSSTFGIAPMAFCTFKPVAPQRSCCKPLTATQSQCPICAYDLNKVEPSPANISFKSPIAPQHFVILLPIIAAINNSPDLAYSGNSFIAFIDSGPPLYLQHCSLRI